MRQRLLIAAGLAICAMSSFAAQATTPASAKPTSATPNSGVVPPSSQRQSAAAQTPINTPAVFDASALGSPLLLDKNWRVGITADPAAAQPDFDDSAWEVRDAQAFMRDVSESDDADSGSRTRFADPAAGRDGQSATSGQRYVWFRTHIVLAPNHPPLALLVELPVTQNASFGITTSGLTPDVFANGQKLMPEGPHGSNPQRYKAISRLYEVNVPPSETSLVLAVRTLYISFGYGSYTSFFSGRTFYLGDPRDLNRELNLWSNREIFERLPRLVYSALLAFLGIFLFVLYFAQKGHVEYLWLALHELVQAPIGFIELAGSSARLDSAWYAALVFQLALIAAYLFFEFLVAFLALPRRLYIKLLRYTSPILAGVGPVLLLVGHSKAIGVLLAIVFLSSILWMLAWSIFIFMTLFRAALRRNFEAALLLIPLALSAVGIVEPVVTSIITENTGKPYVSPLTILAGPVPIHIASIGDFAGILVIVLIIFGRFLRIHRDQERVTNEMAAARTVQELLIPQEKMATPGFEVDSIYSPANEVGGDFFHVETYSEGMLVVIGDVAGKGLKAAMNVSLIMGALRHTKEHDPAQILESLNRVLVGTQSFTTCQALWFGIDGEVTIANAGHLPPYLNSQEVELPGGLPLGVIAQVSYEKGRFFLHPGDRVLLLSDGVVEARLPSGELFGFDRLRHMSQQSAFYLAEAAKAFGQQDDITVLTVRRLVKAMAA